MQDTIIIKPESIIEQLLYNTVLINGIKNNMEASSGTGFFYSVKMDDNKQCHVIITNKHVIAYDNKGTIKDFDSLKFTFHAGEIKNDKMQPNGKSITFIMSDYRSFVVEHNNKSVDLAAIFLEPIKQNIEQQLGLTVYTVSSNDSYILTDNQLLDDTSVAMEVLMIGYPIGLIDRKSFLPIVRKGITASHPALDFQSESIGLIDIACFPGSSGSPVYISMNNYTSKTGNFVLGSKFIFLGVLSAGPVRIEQGEIVKEKIPTQIDLKTNIKQMIHLGYYVKSKEILELSKQILAII